VQQQTMEQPHQLVYIGDAWHNDIAPSFQAGWTPIWLNARQQQPNPEDSHVEYLECQSIFELMPLLKKLKETGAGRLL
jgi:putative hydrolase of the HAD superfamily